MEEPLRLIAENSGHEGSVVLNKVREGDGDWGFDGDSEDYGNLMEKGIIDPAKVTRAALENSASVATMLLTTESLVTDVPQAAGAAPQMPPMDY
jgi:chaperonin GroEL